MSTTDQLFRNHVTVTNYVSEVIEQIGQAETYTRRTNYIEPPREPDMSILNDFLDNLARMEGYYEDIAVDDSRGLD